MQGINNKDSRCRPDSSVKTQVKIALLREESVIMLLCGLWTDGDRNGPLYRCFICFFFYLMIPEHYRKKADD